MKKMSLNMRIGMAVWSSVCSILCGFLMAPMVFSAGEESDVNALKEVREVVKQLQARYEKTKDLQADFTQKTTIEGFERPITSSGKVYIKKPGRLAGLFRESVRFVNKRGAAKRGLECSALRIGVQHQFRSFLLDS